MYYYYPGKKFPAISVTGGHCAVMCPHCQGHYLKSMIQAKTGDDLVETCKRLERNRAGGCLISGGCDVTGSVPIPLEAVERIRKETGLLLNVHTGMVDEKTAQSLARIDPYISFEVPTPYGLRNLYRLNLTQEDYFDSLMLLRGLKVVPHVLVGVDKAEEIETVKKVREMGFSSLVLIVLTPTKGTPLQEKAVDIQAVVETAEVARALFPRLVLGCMRPRLRALEEKVTLFDGVVAPTRWARKKVEQKGIPVEIRETCCVIE